MTVTLRIVLPSKCLPALIFIVSGKCDAVENGLERQAQAYADTSRTFLDRNVKGPRGLSSTRLFRAHQRRPKADSSFACGLGLRYEGQEETESAINYIAAETVNGMQFLIYERLGRLPSNTFQLVLPHQVLHH